MNKDSVLECTLIDISDEDVLKAMREMHGYVDITPDDFKEAYRVAYAHAASRVMHALKASDVMTRPAHVIHLGTDLIATAQVLSREGISGAPVVDSYGKIVGVLSEKDFLLMMGADRTGSFMEIVVQCLKHSGCVATPLRGMQVFDIMTKPAITATEDISIADISDMLLDHNINRLPIVDKEDKPIGMVTRADLVRSYCRIR